MSGANRLFQTMASAGKNTISEVLFGIVTKLNPLEITREGEGEESRAPLTEQFLVLSKMCREFKIKTGEHYHSITGGDIVVSSEGSHIHTVPAATSGSTSAPTAHTHSIPANTALEAGIHNHSVSDVDTSNELAELLIWPGLAVGERVILLSFNDNQRYFVERLEKHSNEV